MNPSKRPSFREVFEKEAAYYLSIGMTYEQYWYGDVWIVEQFREADRLRQERANMESWLNGIYHYDALCCALTNAFRKKSDKPAKYPEKPYELFKREKTEDEKQKEAEEERKKAIAYFNSFAKNKKKLD